MATLKCLACGHDNNVGDQWCSSCSSSLNLRLCSACEAINANDAERCHSCNAQFLVEPEVAEPVAVELDLRPSAGGGAEAPVYEFLPATWQMPEEPVRRRRRTFAASLMVLPLLAAGMAYYFYAGSEAAKAPQVAPKVEAAQKSEPEPNPEAAPKESIRPQTADVKPAQAPAVSGRISAPRTAAAPARSALPSEPKRTAAAVTHTRGAGAEVPSRTAAAYAPAKTAVTALPVSTTLPVSATSAPAANARILPVSESPPATPEPRRTSVTHTKADLTESAVSTAAPAVATQVRTVPAEATSDEPAGCPPAVVALGLCKSR